MNAPPPTTVLVIDDSAHNRRTLKQLLESEPDVQVVDWAMDGVRDEQLVENALWMALIRRQPEAGLLHHSDRGSQYTSQRYQALLKQYGIELSMSGKANCWHNALMESFFGTVKTECVEQQCFATRRQAKTILFDYLEVFYNRQRLHSSLGYQSPAAFELVQV